MNLSGSFEPVESSGAFASVNRIGDFQGSLGLMTEDEAAVRGPFEEVLEVVRGGFQGANGGVERRCLRDDVWRFRASRLLIEEL